MQAKLKACLDLQCTLRHNLKYGQIMKELSAFSEMPEHEAADMCIVAILSHGDDGLIFSSGMIIPRKSLL